MEADLGCGELILILDSDRESRMAMEQILRAAGYRTIASVAKGPGGGSVGAEAPALVLQDLPIHAESSAEGDLRWLTPSETPVVALSSVAEIPARAEAIAGGAAGFVAKPFSAVDLLAEVSAQLARRRSQAVRL